jgi:predicted AlkP superfamily pyrophosphatase or phosphodiesterase
MKRFSLLTGLFVALAAFFLTASAQAATKNNRTVILISVDGLASYYLNDPKAHMPTIRRLAREGAVASRLECSFPTVTWPNHTTLVTGVTPGRHGVIGNNYFDREKQKTISFIPDPLFDKHEIVKTPTVYDVAHNAGLKTAGVIWPATRRASTLDWTVPDVFDQKIFEDSATPGLLAEFKAAGIPYEKQMEWCKLGNAGKPQRDYMYARMCDHILRAKKPNLLLLHLVTVDALEHATGRQTPEAYWACNDSDNRVRDLIESVEAAGLSDRTAFFIVSDHGFITYTKNIKPNVLLKKEGLLTAAGPTIKSRKAYCQAQGGGAFIYVLDKENRAAIIKDLKSKFAATEGVAAVIGTEDFVKHGHLTPDQDPREPDIMLSAKDGYSFSGTAAGDDVISSSGSPKGSHGYLPTHPLMYGSFIASGAGIKKGVKLGDISNMDVAPTIAAVLGLEMKDVDGRVLKEILK